MENNILLTLEMAGIALLILILILTFLAFLVNGMTSLIKGAAGKDDEPEGEEQDEHRRMSVEQNMTEKVAVLAVAFALAESGTSPGSGSSRDNDSNPWLEFHRARGLNQIIRMRRN